MIIKVASFTGRFIPHTAYWDIKLILKDNREKLHFMISYLQIEGLKFGQRRIGAKIQEIYAENVTIILIDNKIILKEWTHMKKTGIELYNPDQPKNLAKCVTVK